jgi:hypothetical protein
MAMLSRMRNTGYVRGTTASDATRERGAEGSRGSMMPLELAALADLVEAVPRALVDALPVPQRRAVDVAVLRCLGHQMAGAPRPS